MGESTCVMHAFSHTSPISGEAQRGTMNNDDPMLALTDSVSFGRFVSESSLAWERWSAFSSGHRRYAEEAASYARPGSVAQKKAFFDAHYKKKIAEKENPTKSSTVDEDNEGETRRHGGERACLVAEDEALPRKSNSFSNREDSPLSSNDTKKRSSSFSSKENGSSPKSLRTSTDRPGNLLPDQVANNKTGASKVTPTLELMSTKMFDDLPVSGSKFPSDATKMSNAYREPEADRKPKAKEVSKVKLHSKLKRKLFQSLLCFGAQPLKQKGDDPKKKKNVSSRIKF